MQERNLIRSEIEMDGNYWSAAQPQGGGEGAAGDNDSGDWRTWLLPDSRQRIVNKIMEMLKRHFPVHGQDAGQWLMETAVRFEEKMYNAAISQDDYLKKISSKMVAITNSLHPNTASSGQNAHGPAPLDSTSQKRNTKGADWQEEVYQKIKSMKEMYFLKLNNLYQKIACEVQRDPLHQRLPNEQIEKLKMFKLALERILRFLGLKKHDIQHIHKEKLLSVEKHINFFLNPNLPRRPSTPLQEQVPQSSMQLQQPQSRDGQTNPSMQPVQRSMVAMRQNNLTNLQHNSFFGVLTISYSQQHLINTVQPGFSVDLGQSNSLNSLQQVVTGSLQQNPVNSPQQVNISSQSGMNPVQANLGSLLQNSNALQQSLPKQHEQQLLQNQQLRQQYHHRQKQQRLFQGQKLRRRQQILQNQQLRQQYHQRQMQQQLFQRQQLRRQQQMLQNQQLRLLYHHQQMQQQLFQRQQLRRQQQMLQNQQTTLLPTHQMSQLQQSSMQLQQPQSPDGRN